MNKKLSDPDGGSGDDVSLRLMGDDNGLVVKTGDRTESRVREDAEPGEKGTELELPCVSLDRLGDGDLSLSLLITTLVCSKRKKGGVGERVSGGAGRRSYLCVPATRAWSRCCCWRPPP